MNRSTEHSASAFENFKNQLNSLSQSMQQFDSSERDQALEILQECIQGFGNKEESGKSNDLKNTSVEKSSDDFPSAKAIDSEENEVGHQNISDDKKLIPGCSTSNGESTTNLKTSFSCPKCGEKSFYKTEHLKHLKLHSGKTKCCSDCRKNFPNTVSYKFHKESNLCNPSKGGRINKCKFCGRKFTKINTYKKHVKAHKQNLCSVCSQTFSIKKHLILHALNVHKLDLGEKPNFRCEVCAKVFVQRRSLVQHYTTHQNVGYKCRVCLRGFDTTEQLEQHETTSHKQLTTNFTCEKCQSTFTRRQQYLVHIKAHDNYRCSECDNSFSNKKVAMSHCETTGHQVEGLEASLICAECGEMFLFPSQLEKHMARHLGNGRLSRTSELYCEKCKMSFKRAKNLRDHLQTKTHLQGDEPKNLLSCDQCDKTFTNNNNLRVHVIRMHKGNKTDHSCVYCDYKTSRLENFKRHVSLHTDKPQFVCDKCGLQLQSKNSLQEHDLKLHSDKKNFSCEKCGKNFSRSSDLNRHLNTHNDTVSFSCHHCGSTYKSYNALNKHIVLAHNIGPVKQARLKKMFAEETNESSEGDKVQTGKPEQKLEKAEMPQIENETSVVESNTIVVVTDCHSQQLMEVPYNLDFAGNKAQVYNQDLDLQVVESMMELDSASAKRGQNVLINVRNIFGRTMGNEYMLTESTMMDNLTETLTEASQHIAVAAEKPDEMPVLQDYMISPDLSFLNV